MCRFSVGLALLCVSSPLLLQSTGAQEPKDTGLLPGNAVWVRRLDTKLDGKLQGEIAAEEWRVIVKNDKLSGHPLEGKKSRAELSGEVVDGQGDSPPVVHWRQDNSNIKGYTQVFSGHRVEVGRIVGTWYDTDGRSGDFELVLQKK